MSRGGHVGEFLKACRARLEPGDVGLAAGVGNRRVAGLRREELAALAGISVDYYIRLEQGRTGGVSDAVLAAVANALRLTDDEHAHLRHLANPTQREPVGEQSVRRGLVQLVNALGTPAFLLGRRMAVLAWNAQASALITDFAARPPAERNLARLVLLDEDVRRRYPDRALVVRNTVGFLRLDAGRHPDDEKLAALVEELCAGSAEFRQQWARHTVSRKRFGIKRFVHPVVGALELDYESLHGVGDEDQLLIVYSARPGSPSEAALRRLGAGRAEPG